MQGLPKVNLSVFTAHYMGGCQNCGPFLGPKCSVPYYNRDPKRGPNFGNYPYIVWEAAAKPNVSLSISNNLPKMNLQIALCPMP